MRGETRSERRGRSGGEEKKAKRGTKRKQKGN
jgi:hypothetical protein